MDAAKANQLVGVWVLKSYERRLGGVVDAPYGEKPEGMLTYDDKGNMSVQFMRVGRPNFAIGDRHKGTAEEIKPAFEGYFAYYGRYEVDASAGTVIHLVEGSLLPNWIGTQQKRFYELSGNHLTLKTPTSVVGGKETWNVLLWEKRA
jgi:hypothetical protein